MAVYNVCTTTKPYPWFRDNLRLLIGVLILSLNSCANFRQPDMGGLFLLIGSVSSLLSWVSCWSNIILAVSRSFSNIDSSTGYLCSKSACMRGRSMREPKQSRSCKKMLLMKHSSKWGCEMLDHGATRFLRLHKPYPLPTIENFRRVSWPYVEFLGAIPSLQGSYFRAIYFRTPPEYSKTATVTTCGNFWVIWNPINEHIASLFIIFPIPLASLLNIIRRQQKFYSLPERYKQIQRFEQRPFVGN